MKRRNRRRRPAKTQPSFKPDFLGWRLETNGGKSVRDAVMAAAPEGLYESCLKNISNMAVEAYERTGVSDLYLVAYGAEFRAQVQAPNFIDRVLTVDLKLPL